MKNLIVQKNIRNIFLEKNKKFDNGTLIVGLSVSGKTYLIMKELENLLKTDFLSMTRSPAHHINDFNTEGNLWGKK